MRQADTIATGEGTTLLGVTGLEVVYSDVILVLRGVSLAVPAGSIVALLGANGAGKTTLLRAVTGLLPLHRGRITKGHVTLDGRPVAGGDPAEIVRAGLSQVMEGRRIFAELAVKDAPAPELLADRDIQEFYLGVGEAGRRSYRDVKTYRRRKRWTA